MSKTQKPDKGERNPLSVVSVKVPFTPSKSKHYRSCIDLRFHPTQKPLELIEYLIKTYTDKNDIVLDFTCGSGTTLVQANELGIHSIGIDISPFNAFISNVKFHYYN